MPEQERSDVLVAIARLEEKLEATTSRIVRVEGILTIIRVAVVVALVAAVAEVI